MTTKEHKERIKEFWEVDFPACIAGKKGAKGFKDLFKDFSFFVDVVNKKPHQGPGEIGEYWAPRGNESLSFSLPLSNIQIVKDFKFLVKVSDSCYAPFDMIAIVFIEMKSNPKGTSFYSLMGHIEDCIWVPIEFGM